jgi:hypothetical protein
MKKGTKELATSEELETFEHFLFEMDDVLEAFLSEASAAGFHLDCSLDSVDALEKYVVSQPDGGKNSRLQNRAARYLGEVFRKSVGGKWELCLKDPKYIYFKLPVLTGYSDKPIEFCPIEVLGNFIVKREPGLLRRAIESHLEFKR